MKNLKSTLGDSPLDSETKWVLFAVVMGALFMLACFYGVYFLGWSKHVVTFMSPLGAAVPAMLYTAIVSKRDGQTGKARTGSIAMAAITGYVGGQVLMAIYVWAWAIVR